MSILAPELGQGNFRGQDPLYEPLGSLEAYKQKFGVAASPTASLFGSMPREAGGFNPNGQRYQTGYQMPRGAGNQGMKAYVSKRLGLM